jgi:hypothetical protein
MIIYPNGFYQVLEQLSEFTDKKLNIMFLVT